MAKLHIMKPYNDPNAGDLEIDIDLQPDLAQQLFKEAMANGYVAYQQEPDGNVVVREFNPDYNTVCRPNYVGG